MQIAACVKWVDLRPEIDPLSGAVAHDDRWFGMSAADSSALEWALRLGETWGASVMVATAGRAASERLLRDALACGASRAVRVEAPLDASSEDVARALAEPLIGVDLVVCGDHSTDRGTGSVPAFLAHHLGARQALGLIELRPDAPGSLEVVRRLDGGRREVLRVLASAVISVEGGTASLRRATLAATMATATVSIEVVGADVHSAPEVEVHPYRPPARVAPAPTGATALERVRSIIGAENERRAPRHVSLEPAAAASAIIEQLRDWGYLE